MSVQSQRLSPHTVMTEAKNATYAAQPTVTGAGTEMSRTRNTSDTVKIPISTILPKIRNSVFHRTFLSLGEAAESFVVCLGAMVFAASALPLPVRFLAVLIALDHLIKTFNASSKFLMKTVMPVMTAKAAPNNQIMADEPTATHAHDNA